jgi:hypothetical protein
MDDLVRRLHELATAPTIAPSAVYANICGEAGREIVRLQAELRAARMALAMSDN